MIWVKALHIIFMTAWLAGVFYLPRLFVNHAMSDDSATQAQLAAMQRRLYRFMTPWLALTLLFGFWLLLDYAWAAYAHLLWLKVKLVLVALLISYHFYCGRVIRQLASGGNQRSHVWFRWFNEAPVLLVFAIIILAVVKPI